MALREILAPVIRLILLISYGAYIGLGLILMSMGIYYSTSVEGSNDFVTLTACVGGFFMMVVGGLGVFANLKQKTLFIFICLILDVLIFIFLLAACITGIFIANGITDPVAEGVQRSYCDDPTQSTHIYCESTGVYDPENSGITFRASNWAGVVELFESGAPPSCKKYNDDVLTQMEAVSASADTCVFTPCATACDTLTGMSTEDCQCLERIAEVLPMSEQSEGCETVAGATCTDLVPATPSGCADPAPSSDSGALTQNEWTAVPEGATSSSPCTGVYGGCANTADTGACRYLAPMDERVRVYERPARTQICPPGCLSAPEVTAVAAVPEACLAIGTDQPTKAAGCRACSEGEATAGAEGCTSAGDAAVCSAVTDLDTATACTDAGQCVYMEQLLCRVNLVDGTTIYNNDEAGATEARTAFVPTATEASTLTGECTAAGAITGITKYEDANCVYQREVQPVTAVAATCNAVGEVGSRMFPAAKVLAVGTENQACTGAACVTKGFFMGNCSAVREAFTTSGGLTNGLGDDCNTCWDHWQYKVVDDVKGNLWPATITVFALFLFIVILVSINYYMIDNHVDDDDGFSPEGIFKILGFVFNGVVMLFGLIVIITGAVILSDLSDGCPAGQDCTNMAIVGIILVGVFVFLTAVVSLVGVILGGIIGLMLLRIANIVFLLSCLFLLICGIAFAIIAGALDETNKQYEDNFDTVRAQYESQDPGLCHGLQDEDCKAKIRALAASSNTGVVIVLSIICFSFLFVTFLTLEAFYIYKGGDGDDDDDDDDDDE